MTSLLFSAAFYGLIGLGVMYVYQRGVERTVYELGGVLQSVGNKWGSEYERWSEIQRQAGAAGGQQPMGGRRW